MAYIVLAALSAAALGVRLAVEAVYATVAVLAADAKLSAIGVDAVVTATLRVRLTGESRSTAVAEFAADA